MISLLLPAALLVLASLTMLSSISMHLFYLQLLWAALGTIVVITFLFFDWRPLLNYRWLIVSFYGLVISLLVAVLFSAPLIRHTRSWLQFGQFTLQPVELAKLSLILVYARFFSRRHVSIARVRTIADSFFYFVALAALVLPQPDLGSTLVLFGIWFVFLLVSGLPPRRIIAGFFLLLLVGAGLWFYGLKDYQRDRIAGVLYPERDPLGINYSVAQSKIAIGSAGFWGKGYKQGTQTQYGFLTEPADDFIFAAFVEEWGWFGGLLLVGIFLMLILTILNVGLRADQNFEKFICLGVAIIFGIQFFLNAGSEVGLSPVIGVTFPFLSYGGSSLLTNSTLLALVNAIGRRS